jgi:hypothetical protein
MPKRTSEVGPDELLVDLDAKGRQLSWSEPVSRRLDQLLDRARRARTDRSEVAAAIIAEADYTEDELVELIHAYRDKRARDVVLDVEPGADVIKLPRPGPGRRRTRSG